MKIPFYPLKLIRMLALGSCSYYCYKTKKFINIKRFHLNVIPVNPNLINRKLQESGADNIMKAVGHAGPQLNMTFCPGCYI